MSVHGDTPASEAPSLESLLQSARVWRAGEGAAPGDSALSTGLPGLDALLAGGWPRGALTEILAARRGIGALQLLVPTLARLNAAGGWLAWVAPPWVPYGPALAAAGLDLSRILWIEARSPPESLWALEQVLRSGQCAAALGWADGVPRAALRRLQLAAAAGQALALLFRPLRRATEPSPAALRLSLRPAEPGRLAVEVLKRRGGRPAGPVAIALPSGPVERGGEDPARQLDTV